MKTIGLFLSIYFATCFVTTAQNMPFPQCVEFEGAIKPNHKSSAELGFAVCKMYDYWKEDFLKPTDFSGGYYVLGECTGCNVASKGTSEGQGYGMIITALMAGYDPDAKTFFDGLFYFFDNYRSVTNNELMNWNVAADERDPWTGSATDGDMDIAYSLLLAHYQWGSVGEVDYLQEAIDMITLGLKVGDMNTESKRVMLGDWDNDQYTTRPSDWMTGHFEAYAEATGDDFWIEASDTIYSMMSQIIQEDAMNTGLMPDFVIGEIAQPAEPNFLEGPNDGAYYYNACRFPWRIASDFLHYENPKAHENLKPFLAWAENQLNGDYNNYTAGYSLDGSALNSYTDIAFTAPLVLAFCTDSTYQEELNLGWDYIEDNYWAYFDASINLLSQLMITGNWWAPIEDKVVSSVLDFNLEYPFQGSTVNQNDSIRFSFSGIDMNEISKVTYYEGEQKIATLTNVPFALAIEAVNAGELNYRVVAESADGKYRTFSRMITVQADNSIEHTSSQVTIFPNPTKDKLYIDNPKNKIINTITVYTIQGKLVYNVQVTPNSSNYVIDLERLQAGTFILEVSIGNSVEHIKIIKE